MSRILTTDGQQYVLSEEDRRFGCLIQEGESLTLYTVNDWEDNPAIYSLVTRLKRTNVNYSLEYKNVFEIESLYDDKVSHEDPEAPVSSSDMQDHIKNLFEDAVAAKASDIRIRVDYKKKETVIRFRIDGDYSVFRKESVAIGSAMIQTMYETMTDDTAEETYKKNQEQEARISDQSKMPIKLDGIRLSTGPTSNGNLLVARLLYDTTGAKNLSDLGISKLHIQKIAYLKKQPYGAILVSGPTGSGKSTLLEKILNSLYEETGGRKSLITVEDPPEYEIEYADQKPVNKQEGESKAQAFARTMEKALRQDPDILMIGEIRDSASAKLAIDAAMTGHVVYSTIHVSNAISTIPRLEELGVSFSAITDPNFIKGLINIRLLKKLCDHCKVPLNKALNDNPEKYKSSTLARIRRSEIRDMNAVYVCGPGCDHCRNGIKGRVPVLETILVDQKLMGFLRNRDHIAASDYVKHHHLTLLKDTVFKIQGGLVDPFMAEETIGLLSQDKIEEDHVIDEKEVDLEIGDDEQSTDINLGKSA